MLFYYKYCYTHNVFTYQQKENVFSWFIIAQQRNSSINVDKIKKIFFQYEATINGMKNFWKFKQADKDYWTLGLSYRIHSNGLLKAQISLH